MYEMYFMLAGNEHFSVNFMSVLELYVSKGEIYFIPLCVSVNKDVCLWSVFHYLCTKGPLRVYHGIAEKFKTK